MVVFKVLSIFSCVIFSIFASAQKTNFVKKDTVFVFYLGGQSNMKGLGKNADLPKTLNKTFQSVMIFDGNAVPDNQDGGGLGIWDVLKPGHGSGFRSNGIINQLSNTFGIELSFADALLCNFPNKKFAIIKYACNGSSLDSIGTAKFGSWAPDLKSRDKAFRNQYDFFLQTVQNAFSDKDINKDGVQDVLIPAGILWMQGESDANKTLQIANSYAANLKRMMDLTRAALRDNNIPIVIGKISD